MTDRTHPDSGRIITSSDVIADLHARIAELESELEAVGAGGVQALSAAPAIGDELRDTLVAVSAAIAERDDRAAQKMIREILAASPTPQSLSAAPVEVADAMADSQYLAGVSAGWNAANADNPNEALRKLHESRAGYLKPLGAARKQGGA